MELQWTKLNDDIFHRHKCAFFFLAVLLIVSLLSTVIYINVKTYHPELKFGSLPPKALCHEGRPKTRATNFIEYLADFPFNGYMQAIRTENRSGIEHFASKAINHLTPYLLKSPILPANAKCVRPVLRTITEEDCKRYPTAFTGKLRQTPAKLGHMIQLGFDVDILEIHLHEIYDVVDFFFILEATRTHLNYRPKALVWEHVQFQKRFSNFSDKIVHFVLDDSEMPVKPIKDSTNIWELEGGQEKRLWELFLEWNAKNLMFADTDIVSFGDTDEISMRDNFQLIKYCEITDPVEIGIWYPLGKLGQAYQTDFPVGGNPYTYGDPTFWTLERAKKEKDYPTRKRGFTGKYLYGGMHMSDHRYLPFLLLKLLSCTECNFGLETIANISKIVSAGTTLELEQYVGDLSTNLNGHGVVPFADVRTDIGSAYYLPWFYACNEDRYAYWKGEHDLRLDVLVTEWLSFL